MLEKTLTYFNYDLYFKASNLITNEEELLYELENFCHREGRSYSVIENGIELKVKIDGEMYKCVVGDAFRATKIPMIPIDLISGRFLGYEWVYLYKC